MKEAFNFRVIYSDGSIYQGRIYAAALAEALRTLLAELPAADAGVQPIKLEMEMKLG